MINKKMDAVSCGIDFGTSNSTCAIAHNTKIELIDLEDGKKTIPSAIFFHENGDIDFGRAAIRSYLKGFEGRLMRGLKSVLGTPLMNDKTRIGNRRILFTQALEKFLQHIKSKADQKVGETIEQVVLGRPVHFHDDNPEADLESEDALRQIAHDIGFKHVTFQYEPIAAAYAHEQKISSMKLSMVIDLGGGTSDFTVIRLDPKKKITSDRQSDILANFGIRIGGTDFDQKISMKKFMPHLGLGSKYSPPNHPDKVMNVPIRSYADLSDWSRVNMAQSARSIRATEKTLRGAHDTEKLSRLLSVQRDQLGHKLLQLVENTKIDLTEKETSVGDLSSLGIKSNIELSRSQMEGDIFEQVERIKKGVQNCLAMAGVKSKDIDLIVLTGGSTELAIINRMVEEVFPRAEISNDNKFASVGLGLAEYAKHYYNHQKRDAI